MMSQLLQNLALKHLSVSFLSGRLAKTTTEASPSINIDNQLSIDVSIISKADAGTGIQRVVRNLHQELLTAPPADCRVCPVAATRKQGYCYLPTDFLRLIQPNNERLGNSSESLQTGSLMATQHAKNISPLGWGSQ